MIVVFTDLDGTLLNHDSYSFEAAVTKQSAPVSPVRL